MTLRMPVLLASVSLHTLTPLMPTPQRTLTPTNRSEETVAELAKLKQELRGALPCRIEPDGRP